LTELTVELSPEALDDARAVEAWYDQRNPRAATGFVDELERALGLLGHHPNAGQRWDHTCVGTRVRRLPLPRYPFVLFYAAKGDMVRC